MRENNPAAFTTDGDGFQEWSIGCRDVEEMLEFRASFPPPAPPEAHGFATGAREVRIDFQPGTTKRSSLAAQFEKRSPNRCVNLKRDVAEGNGCMRRVAEKQAIHVPIDRDSRWPAEFTEADASAIRVVSGQWA